MDLNELKWARWANLKGLFDLLWTMLREDTLWDFLQTWEATKDGRIQGRGHGEEIIIDKVFIHEQLGISKEGIVDVANATFEKAKTALKKIIGPHAFIENE